jgi:alkylation response protein AidB-like acyl-CoA dehydrogenase
MEFGLSKEQTLLQDSVFRQLQRNAPLERVQRFVDQAEPRADDVWNGLCELGIPGMVIPEQFGGIGCSLMDTALVAETLGACVAPVPFVATVVMAPLAISLAGSEQQHSRWLGELAEGNIIAGVAIGEVISSREGAGVVSDRSRLSGKALFALDFEADLYIVADQNQRLFIVESDTAGLQRRLLTSIDGTRRVGELVFEDVAAEQLPGSDNPDVCARLIDAGRIILAADMLGASQTMLNKAVEYAKTRVQFGRPIGSFQAVKHMCAEMAAELEPCRAMVWYAAHAFDTMPEESRLVACHTKAHLSEVGTFIARTATEVHGGIGFTDELGLHLWFKRIGANRQLLGSPNLLREEAAQLQDLVESRFGG